MYVKEERGLLNNFAIEPKITYAEYPSPEQQRRYIWQGAAAIALVTLLVLTALSVS